MTGDQNDFLARIRTLLPPWFASVTPILDGLLTGLASALVPVYQLINYAALQMRLRTATDGWLDLIAADYLGPSFLRASGQSDSAFRNRILINILRERATRAAMMGVLIDLTGRTPSITEPMRPADVGGYSIGGVGYSTPGCYYGSLDVPCWCFVRVLRPNGSGGIAVGSVPDSDIYSAIESVRPAGVTVWVNISN